jgi:hypothetical protein
LLQASGNIATVAKNPIDTIRRTAFPNPERLGCPEPAIFDLLKRREISFDDPVWTHIDHCSPCYCQLAEIRESLFKQDRTHDLRRVARVSLVVIALVGLGISFYFWQKRSKNEGQSVIASNRGEAAVLNFEDGSEIRGSQSPEGVSANSGIQHLPRNQLSLIVYLPLGSPAGEYELEISRSPGGDVWRAKAHATIKDGLTSIPVEGDLRNVPAGEYRFRFRRLDETWHEKAVLLQ